jgi:AcrR family transcriptional regulator
MARTIPAHRFEQLADAATDIFIAQGYRRSQMAHVADALGLAKGTLYGYVSGKEALFRFALEHCDRTGPIATPERIPLPEPKPGEILELFDARIEREGAMPLLTAAIQAESADDVRREIAAIVSELYAVLRRNHRGLRMLEACAADHPEIQERWNSRGRAGYRELLAEYLRRRSETGAVQLAAAPAAVARFVIETTTTWAVHIRYDRFPQNIADRDAEAMVVHFVTSGLLAAAGDRALQARGDSR